MDRCDDEAMEPMMEDLSLKMDQGVALIRQVCPQILHFRGHDCSLQDTMPDVRPPFAAGSGRVKFLNPFIIYLR